jgi:hypothetical protein
MCLRALKSLAVCRSSEKVASCWPDAFDAVSVIGLAALVLVALATAGHYGVSNDEEVQQRYGELIIAYYASDLADQSVFHFDNLFYYPTHMNCDRAMDGRIIDRIERLGVVIGVVKDRRTLSRSSIAGTPGQSNIR